jgi:hypothetical protein
MNPGIQQHIARAAVEAGTGLVGSIRLRLLKPPTLRRHGCRPLAEQGFMEGRHQRRALAACGHVAAAEVADHGDTGQLGEQRRIADLYGEAAGRLMANGLPMAADGANGVGLELLLSSRVDALRGEFGPVVWAIAERAISSGPLAHRPSSSGAGVGMGM